MGNARSSPSLLACGWPPHKNYKWQDMQKLISYGKDAYDYYEYPEKTIEELPAVPVKDGIDGQDGWNWRLPIRTRNMSLCGFLCGRTRKSKS